MSNDEQDDALVGYAMHSKVAKDLMSIKDTTGRLMFEEGIKGGRPVLQGKPVIMSDKMTKTTDSPAKYITALFKEGALALWLKKEPEVFLDVDGSKPSEVMFVHVYYVVHRYRVMADRSLPGVALLLTK